MNNLPLTLSNLVATLLYLHRNLKVTSKPAVGNSLKWDAFNKEKMKISKSILRSQFNFIKLNGTKISPP